MTDIPVPPSPNAPSSSDTNGVGRPRAGRSVLLALGASASLLQFNGFHGADVVKVMLLGALSDKRSIAEVLLKATPLILIGVGLCVAFRCSIWNIGAEGQLYAGASAATACGVNFVALPAWLHIVLILAAGSIAGAAWGALAGLLRVYFRASEVVTTIMLNYIAIIFTSYLATGPLKDPPLLTRNPRNWPATFGCRASCRRRGSTSAF